MNKDQMLRILVVLSQLEGYIIGRMTPHVLPDYLSKELSDVCELLASKIKEST